MVFPTIEFTHSFTHCGYSFMFFKLSNEMWLNMLKHHVDQRIVLNSHCNKFLRIHQANHLNLAMNYTVRVAICVKY